MTIEIHTSRLVLGSGSPYRKELLSRLRIPFDVIIPNIDESPLHDENPKTTALRLAHAKARAIATLAPNALIIASDQIAMLNNEYIGKPGSHTKALLQLQKMRGRRVVFHTALCLLDNRNTSNATFQLENIQTFVTFRDLPDVELDAYLRIEQPYDCAGSAKNEGLGITILDKIESTDPTALTGLPLITLTSMLRHIGMPLFSK